MNKKIFVHDRIVHHGGAEMILKDLIEEYSPGKTIIFTLFSKEKSFFGHTVITALPERINTLLVSGSKSKRKGIRRLVDYRNMMPFYPLLVWILRQKIKRHSPKTVIVSSFAAVKNVLGGSLQPIESILYCHSPMQYIWENYTEYCNKLSGIKKSFFKLSAWYLRKRDKRKNNYTKVYTNSHYTKSCLEKRYGWTGSSIRYPRLPQKFITTPALKHPFEYYLFVGRTVKFVRELDKIITMCNTLHLPLIVMGSGPDEIELKEIAGSSITFIGNITDIQEKVAIIKQAKGLINLAKESCGIATMEALSLGVPVLGYNQGGTAELVHTQEFGTLIDTKEIESLIDALQAFHQRSFNRRGIKKEFITFYKKNRPSFKQEKKAPSIKIA